MQSTIRISYCVSLLMALTEASSNIPCGDSCDKYTTQLRTAYYLHDHNVCVVGGDFGNPIDTINSMCRVVNSEISECYICSDGSGPGFSNNASQLVLLDAWWDTCATFNANGPSAAYACWKSVPGGGEQCRALATTPGTPESTTFFIIDTSSTSQTSETSTNTSLTPATFASISQTTMPFTNTTTQVSETSTSAAPTSATSETSSTANSGHNQRIAWRGGFAGTVMGVLIDLLF